MIEIGKVLSGVSSNTDEEENAGEKFEKICAALNMTEDELRLCEHKIDITKTCRSLIKHIFPDANDRAKMLISSMDSTELKAIQGKQFTDQCCLSTFTYTRLCSIGSSRTGQSAELIDQQRDRKRVR